MYEEHKSEVGYADAKLTTPPPLATSPNPNAKLAYEWLDGLLK